MSDSVLKAKNVFSNIEKVVSQLEELEKSLNLVKDNVNLQKIKEIKDTYNEKIESFKKSIEN